MIMQKIQLSTWLPGSPLCIFMGYIGGSLGSSLVGWPESKQEVRDPLGESRWGGQHTYHVQTYQFMSCVTLSKLLNLSGPWFPHVYNRDNSSFTSQGCCED